METAHRTFSTRNAVGKYTSVHPDHLQRQRYMDDGGEQEKCNGSVRDLQYIIHGFRDPDITDYPVRRVVENKRLTFKGEGVSASDRKNAVPFQKYRTHIYGSFSDRVKGRD